MFFLNNAFAWVRNELEAIIMEGEDNQQLLSFTQRCQSIYITAKLEISNEFNKLLENALIFNNKIIYTQDP